MRLFHRLHNLQSRRFISAANSTTAITAVVIFAASLSACGRVPIKYDFGQSELKFFNDCNEMQSNVHAQLDAYRRDLAARPPYLSIPIGAPVADQAAAAGFTNVQEQGVDESDQVKIGQHHVYTVTGENIQVNARSNLSQAGMIAIAGLWQVKLYTQDDLLVMVGQGQKTDGSYQTFTEVRSYRSTSESVLPTLLGTRQYSGSLSDSRLTAGRLILIMNDTLPTDDDLSKALLDQPVKVNSDKVSGVSCSRVSQPPLLDQDFRMLKVASVDVQAPLNESFDLALMGSGDQVYMTTDALYVSKNSLNWLPWTDNPATEKAYALLREKLIITKISFDKNTGSLTPVAMGITVGRAKDQFSYQEITRNNKTYIAVATSTGELGYAEYSTAQNHLWVFNQSDTMLKIVGQVSNFGTGEDIRSVRFVDPMAYVVTFKKTDPLFAIDLNDPENPQIKGALKIPGFSTYMQSLAQDRVIGLGFDAADMGDFAWFQGIQVSLFDVSQSESPLRLDNHIYGDRGSSSEATWDHHAFFADVATGLIAFPLVQLARPAGSSPETYGQTLTFTGAVVLKLSNDKLIEQAKLSHSEWIPAACASQMGGGRWWQNTVQSQDIRRIYKVDGKLLTVSSYGIKQHLLSDPDQVLNSVKFATPADCPLIPILL